MAQLHGLLYLLAGRGGLSDVHGSRVDATLDQRAAQHVFHLRQLEVGLRGQHHRALLALKGSLYPLEIKAVGDDASGLVHRVGQLVQINFRNNIK